MNDLEAIDKTQGILRRMAQAIKREQEQRRLALERKQRQEIGQIQNRIRRELETGVGWVELEVVRAGTHRSKAKIREAADELERAGLIRFDRKQDVVAHVRSVQ